MGKWSALGDVADKSLADVDPDSISNIYDEAELGVPKPGPYLGIVKRLQGTESKAGDPMLKMVVEIAEPKGSKKAKYNGYGIWYYRVTTKDWASAVNQFLNAILDGKTPAQRKKVVEQFWAGNVILDDDGMVKKIGTWLVPDSLPIGINTRLEKSADYGDRLAITGVMPASDRPATKLGPEPEDEDDDDDDEPEEDAEPEETDEEAERREDLEGLGLIELRKLAKELGTTGKGKAGLIDAILDAEFAEQSPIDLPEEDEDEDEDEELEEEEEGDEYDEMDRVALRAEAKELGVRVLKSMSDDDLREALRAAGEEDEEDDDDEVEEEPEPPKAAARQAKPTRGAAKRRAADNEPPF